MYMKTSHLVHRREHTVDLVVHKNLGDEEEEEEEEDLLVLELHKDPVQPWLQIQFPVEVSQ